MRSELVRQAMTARQLQPGTLAAGIKAHPVSLSDILHEPSKTVGTTMALKICGFLHLRMQDLFQDEVDAFKATLPTLKTLVVPVQGRRSNKERPCPVIHTAMATQGLSPANMASLCGVTRTYMSLLLNTGRTISLRMGIKLAAILDIPLDDIYRDELEQVRGNTAF